MSRAGGCEKPLCCTGPRKWLPMITLTHYAAEPTSKPSPPRTNGTKITLYTVSFLLYSFLSCSCFPSSSSRSSFSFATCSLLLFSCNYLFFTILLPTLFLIFTHLLGRLLDCLPIRFLLFPFQFFSLIASFSPVILTLDSLVSFSSFSLQPFSYSRPVKSFLPHCLPPLQFLLFLLIQLFSCLFSFIVLRLYISPSFFFFFLFRDISDILLIAR